MTLRAATLDDLDVIIRLYVKGWQRSYAGLLDSTFLAQLPDNPRSRDYLHSLLAGTRDDAVVLIAESDDVATGFIAAGRSRDAVKPDLAEIYAVYVDLEYQSTGVGYQLFAACGTLLAQHGFQQLHIWTFAANTKARAAYTRWGGLPGGPMSGPTGSQRAVAVGGAHLEEVGFIWNLI